MECRRHILKVSGFCKCEACKEADYQSWLVGYRKVFHEACVEMSKQLKEKYHGVQVL